MSHLTLIRGGRYHEKKREPRRIRTPYGEEVLFGIEEVNYDLWRSTTVEQEPLTLEKLRGAMWRITGPRVIEGGKNGEAE